MYAIRSYYADIARLSDAVVATMAEQDRAASAAFPMAFCATGFGRTAAVARMRLEVESSYNFV